MLHVIAVASFRVSNDSWGNYQHPSKAGQGVLRVTAVARRNEW